MKKNLKRWGAILIAIAMVLSMSVPAWAEGEGGEGSYTPTPINWIYISKMVEVGPQLSNPAATFRFVVEPVEAFDRPAPATGLRFYNSTGRGFENYAQCGVTAGSGSKTITEGLYPLYIQFNQFSDNGWYCYKIYEDTTEVEKIAGYTYDPGKYIWLYMENNPDYDSNNPGNTPAHICTHIIVTKNSNEPNEDNAFVATDKVTLVDGRLQFENYYTKSDDDNPDDPNPNSELHDLTVKKEVTGNQHNANDKFNFKVTLTGVKASRSVIITSNDNGATISRTPATVTKDGQATITVTGLSKGSEFTIHGLIKGETYTIEETNGTGYDTTTKTNEEDSVNGKTATGSIADDDLKVVYLNHKQGTIPTGLFINYKPYWAMAGIALLLALLMIRRRRNREADEF